MTELQVNLYEAFLPIEVELLVRPRPEKLEEGELLLGRLDESLSVVAQAGLSLQGTSSKSFPTSDLSPGLMQRLLVDGLATSFSQRKCMVEREKLSFNVFDPKDRVKVDFDFIELLRGISFRAEHLTIQSKSYYAFYASMRVRRRFTDSVDSAKLLKAALGEEVRVMDGEHSERVKLLRLGDRHVEVETGDFTVKQVLLKDVQIGATPSILSRYSQAIGQGDAHSRILVASQVASFRYNASGARVRSWLKAEFNYVGSWLAKMSQGGRLPFMLPNSTAECYLGVKASTARGGGR